MHTTNDQGSHHRSHEADVTPEPDPLTIPPHWAHCPLDWHAHAIDAWADHPLGLWIARCGHRLSGGLAHEWKHLLDHTMSDVIYRHLGSDNAQQRERKIERIADHFAACLLMPRTWVKNAWTSGIQDIPALAGLFMVSEDAMRVRLHYLGLLDDDERPIHTYFRRIASLDLSPAV